MSFKPISYLQTDPKWKSIKYATSAENATIGGSGCGPTSAAMVVAEWTGKTETPDKACAWSMKNGYKATGQGTYYSFFTPYFKKFGLTCTQLNGANVYHNKNAAVHATVKEALKNGDYIIACMGKGDWTSSGHFILVYGLSGDCVLINDPNSTKESRLKAKWDTFIYQVKYYFRIAKPSNFTPNGDKYIVTDKDGYLNIRAGAGTSYNVLGKLMKGDVVSVEKISGSWARIVYKNSRAYVSTAGITKGAESMGKFNDTKGHWAEKVIDELAEMGIVSGDDNGKFRPNDSVTRAEAAVMIRNAVKYVTGK